jgi:hypothetical protein
VTLVLGDHDHTSAEEEEFDVEPPGDEMRRFTVYKDIRTDAKRVYFQILNKTAEETIVKVDNAMLHVGEFPLMFKPSSGWREMRWDFSDSTASAGTDMDAAGILGGRYPMPGEAGGYLMLKAAARPTTLSDGDTTYQLCVDSTAVNGISITILGDPAEEEANHVTTYTDDAHECTDYLQAPICSTTGGIPAEGVIFSVWGYYYAS